MQCRSHSRRRTVECLFVTACSMDEYAEEKRTEKNLIVRSGISEAETTNNKRLHALDVLYWSYTDTKHRAASLRQQSFLSIGQIARMWYTAQSSLEVFLLRRPIVR